MAEHGHPRSSPFRATPLSWVATAILAVLTTAPLAAQPGELRFQHLSVEDGLSHSTVYTIHQDSIGFLWVGTQEGLDRYVNLS